MSDAGGLRLHHVALRVADFDATLRFYCDGLGCSLAYRWIEDGEPAAFLDAGDGTYVEVFGGGDGARRQGTILHVALHTDDCAAAVERARAAGARITQEPETVELAAEPHPVTVRLAFCTGPDGEIVEFLQSADL